MSFPAIPEFEPADIEAALRAGLRSAAESDNPTVESLLSDLQTAIGKLLTTGNIEDAIGAYRLSSNAAAKIEEVKKGALALTESMMRESGEGHYRCAWGSAGWTSPNPTRKVDTKGLLLLAEHDATLRSKIAGLVTEETPSPRFYIR